MKKAIKIVHIAYIVMVLLSVWFTFLAIINDKFGERIATYAILYGLAVLPQVSLNVVLKILAIKNHSFEKRCAGDVVQLITAIVVLLIMIPMASSHDIIFIIPWVVVLVLNLIIYCLYRNYRFKK